MEEYLYWLSMFDFILKLYSVIMFKRSVNAIFAAHHIIRHHSCGNLLHCYRFTLWLSTKTWECNARICSTQSLCLIKMILL